MGHRGWRVAPRVRGPQRARTRRRKWSPRASKSVY
jgi:hypothetical protein